MTMTIVLVTLVASLLSGLIGVLVSFYFFQRLERRKMKMETARKLFGGKHNTSGDQFQEALNEVMLVFSDSEQSSPPRKSFGRPWRSQSRRGRQLQQTANWSSS